MITKPDLRSINEQTYLYLQQQIITNKMKPGSRINYEELRDQLGISKTPLRDAINRLAQDGLVEIKPRSGTFVSFPSLKDAIEVMEIRKALERQSVENAISKIPKTTFEALLKLNMDIEKRYQENRNVEEFLKSDIEFHRTIVKYSNNNRIITIMGNLYDQFTWLGFLIIDNVETKVSEAVKHHEEILKAMIDSNVELAKNLVEAHIEDSKRSIIKRLSVRK
ncbi:GntR family transcriptional regulator [Neobacillus niacini]|uniref:GntR family transcriptional regulator n=1 Tax=Neobacillus niacini TaxID=86668 RepID=UPI002FFF2204